MNRRLSRSKEWLFGVISVFFGFGIVLGLLEIIMHFFPVAGIHPALPVNAASPLMRYPPHSSHQYSSGWNFAIAQKKWANNDGYYSDYDYIQTNKPVMAIIGDSFVEAEQIPNSDTAQALLQIDMGNNGRVYGFGIQGAPLSQYLIFAAHAKQEYQPKTMVFIIIANDFDQSLTKYAGDFIKGMYLFSDTTPQAKLVMNDYEGSERPGLRGLLKHSSLLGYLYNNVGLNAGQIKAWFKHPDRPTVYFGGIDAEASEEKIADSQLAIGLFFQHLTDMSGLPPERILFVVDGIREVKDEAQWPQAQQSYFGKMREYFMQAARQRGYEVIDMHPTFYQAQQVGQKIDFIPQDWHWNSLGNRLVAGAIRNSEVYQRTFTPEQ